MCMCNLYLHEHRHLHTRTQLCLLRICIFMVFSCLLVYTVHTLSLPLFCVCMGCMNIYSKDLISGAHLRLSSLSICRSCIVLAPAFLFLTLFSLSSLALYIVNNCSYIMIFLYFSSNKITATIEYNRIKQPF